MAPTTPEADTMRDHLEAAMDRLAEAADRFGVGW
jgi:hypothetical protein